MRNRMARTLVFVFALLGLLFAALLCYVVVWLIQNVRVVQVLNPPGAG